MGVRRAVEAAENALVTYDDRNVYSLGPLIHNPVVLSDLKQRGLKIMSLADTDAAAASDVVILRAHGVHPSIKTKLEKKHCTVIDATCPRVMLSQKRAADYAKRGWTVILAGDAGHGEVVGIEGCAGKNFVLLESFRATLQYTKKKALLPHNAILLSQTTFNSEEFRNIAVELKKRLPNLKVFDTICPATKERQSALEKLCAEVDGVLVIGGKNSANSARLYLRAAELCPYVAFIETAEEIPDYFFDLKRVGITAGASTPDAVIASVEESLTGKSKI